MLSFGILEGTKYNLIIKNFMILCTQAFSIFMGYMVLFSLNELNCIDIKYSFQKIYLLFS
jgi:hypothetical protein